MKSLFKTIGPLSPKQWKRKGFKVQKLSEEVRVFDDSTADCGHPLQKFVGQHDGFKIDEITRTIRVFQFTRRRDRKRMTKKAKVKVLK